LDQTSTVEEFNKIAADPSTFGWAIFLGASSPAIWTASQKLVQSRITAVTAAVNAELAQKDNALQAAHSTLSQQPTPEQQSQAQAVVRDTIDQAAKASPEDADVGALYDNLLTTLLPAGPTRPWGVQVVPTLDPDIRATIDLAAKARPDDVDVDALASGMVSKLASQIDQAQVQRTLGILEAAMAEPRA
jgi:hypothetical protein